MKIEYYDNGRYMKLNPGVELSKDSDCKIEVNGAEVKITFADAQTAKLFAEYAADVTAKNTADFNELCAHLLELQTKFRETLSADHKFAFEVAQNYWNEILAVYAEIVDSRA